MGKTLLTALLMLFSSLSLAQTHTYCPLDSDCTWTGNHTFNGSLTMAGPPSTNNQVATKSYVDTKFLASGYQIINLNASPLPAHTTLNFKSLTPGNGQAGVSCADNSGAGTTDCSFYSQPIVNVVEVCGAVGDGVTDDTTAINNCLSNHPSATIYFPKTQAAGHNDYRITSVLLMHGNGQRIIGSGPGAQCTKQVTTIAPDTGVSGIEADNANSVDRGEIDYIEIVGPTAQGWIPSKRPILPGTHGGAATASNADGLRIGTGNFKVQNVSVCNFPRHGVNYSSTGNDSWHVGNSPDFFYFANIYSDGNGGAGFYGTATGGGDSQMGTFLNDNAFDNQIWGFYDDTPYGNVYIAPHTSGNFADGTSAGATVNISSISVTSNVVTVVVASSQTWVVNNWIVVAGVTNASFNGTYVIQSVVNNTTFTYNLTLADTSSSGGTSRLATNTEAWTAAGLTTGNYGGSAFTISPSGGIESAALIHPYLESGQCYRLNGVVNVIGAFAAGGNGPCSGFLTPLTLSGSTWSTGVGIITYNSTNTSTGLEFQFQGSDAYGHASNLWLFENQAGTQEWVAATGSNSTIPYFLFEDGTTGSHVNRLYFKHADVTSLDSAGNAAINFNDQANSGTGGVKFYGGGATPSLVASIDSSGKGTFNAGVRLTPTVFSSAPTCAAGTEGLQWAFTDSTTATWGATISGTGVNHVLGYCDGSAWTVAAD